MLSLPAPLPSIAAGGLSKEEVNAKLSRVPIFVVTNSEAAPYLTEMDAAGKRFGSVFLGPRDAGAVLQQIVEEAETALRSAFAVAMRADGARSSTDLEVLTASLHDAKTKGLQSPLVDELDARERVEQPRDEDLVGLAEAQRLLDGGADDAE